MVTLQPYWTYDDVNELAIEVENNKNKKLIKWRLTRELMISTMKNFSKPNRNGEASYEEF